MIASVARRVAARGTAATLASARRLCTSAGAADFSEAIEALEVGKLPHAISLFAKAGEVGHPDANFYLGLAYDGLIGTDAGGDHPIELDAAAAVRCYRRAAEGGHAEAMLNLAMSLRNGEGVEAPDVAEAFTWLTNSAEAGSDRGQFNAAVALDPLHPPYGTPGDVDPAKAMIPKDAKAAVSLYKQAVEQGHGKAMVNYGICLYTGTGCTKDVAAAKELWLEASDLGVEQANFCLKNMEDSPGKFENIIE